MTQTSLIQIENMTKIYQMGELQVHALRGVSVDIQEGEYVAIMGTSGSGKSTLMNMIGLLDRPTGGSYKIRGTEASTLTKNQLAELRNREGLSTQLELADSRLSLEVARANRAQAARDLQIARARVALLPGLSVTAR